jgi:actin-like ATPase involved in cell morphogenesis
MSTWYLAIDFGTSNTCAAIVADSGSTAVGFGPDQTARMPSGVLLRPNGGFVVGYEAQRQAPIHPEWYDPAPKRSIGQATMLLGDREVPVVESVAAVLSAAASEARRQRGGTPPVQVCLTCPARWGTARQSVLRDAATRAGLGEVVLISEPEAAAAYFAKHDNVLTGRSIAVYDLGGGTFDVAVLTATRSGFRLIGRPGGIDPLGGDDIDERLLSLTTDRAALQTAGGGRLAAAPDVEWQAHRAALRQEIRRAKEDLATSDTTEFVLPGLGATAQLSRADLRTAAGDDIDASVTEFLRTITLAGITVDQLAGIYLAGGSSRLPLVRESLSRRLAPAVQRSVRTLNDPKAAVALGAAELLHEQDSTPVGPPSGLQPAARPRQPLKPYQFVAAAIAVVLLLVAGVFWFQHRDSNVVSGTLRDTHGKSMPNVELVVSKREGGNGSDYIRTRTDSNGGYTGLLPRGSYTVNASAHLERNGTAVEVPLVPHKFGAEVLELPTSGGATLDLDLKTSGRKPETSGGAVTDYWGGTLSIYQWFTTDGNDPIASLDQVTSDLKVTFHFEPIGPLLDGSSSEAFDVTRSISDLVGQSGILDHDEVLYDIPLGTYVLTATLNAPSGPIPLALRDGTPSPPQEQVTIPLVELCTQCIESTSKASVEVGIDASYLN